MSAEYFLKTRNMYRPETIKGFRLKYHLYRPIKKGWTVREIRKCKYCGKDIEITHRNPHQKFCNTRCYFSFESKKAFDRDCEGLTDKDIKQFYDEWINFVKFLISEYRGTVYSFEIDEIFADFLYKIPNIIYHMNKRNLEKDIHKRNFLGKVIRNLIRKKLGYRITKQENEISIEELLFLKDNQENDD